MKIPGRNRSAEKICYKVALLLLISVAALSNAEKDLNRIQALAGDVAHSMYELLDAGVVTVYGKSVSLGENSCPAEVTAFDDTEQLRLKGRVAPGKAIEIEGINCLIRLSFNAATGGYSKTNKRQDR